MERERDQVEELPAAARDDPLAVPFQHRERWRRQADDRPRHRVVADQQVVPAAEHSHRHLVLLARG